MEETSKRRRGLSLRIKLTFGLIVIIAILFAGLNTVNVLSHRKSQRDEALANNETIALMVAGALIPELASHDLRSERIRTYCNNFLSAAMSLSKKNKDLAFVVIVDHENRVVSGTAKPHLVTFPDGLRRSESANAVSEIARLEGRLGGDMRVIRFPLKVAGKGDLGRLIVGTSLARINALAQRELIFNLVMFVAGLILMIVYASFMLGHLVVKPLNRVVSAMRAVQAGKLDEDVDLKRGDEMGELADTYNFMVQGLREREHLKDAFSRYVSKQVYEKFRSGQINLAGETKNATILFSDIRSFTTLSEQLTPTAVVAMLNEYFTEMVEIVLKYDGFLNKFIGDAIMAIYNVPLDQTEPELRAVKTALEMVAALDKLNEHRLMRGQFAIKIGIGVNTGPVVAGNLGHEQRLEYTVIGDAVNLAQRLESQTKVAGATILISEATYRPCAQYIHATPLPPVKVKGKQENVVLYAVHGMKDGSVSIAPPSDQAAQNLAAAAILENG